MSRRLLNLHGRVRGHPSDTAAVSPAIVLSATAAFEGFAENFTAIALANQGAGYAEIASKVGKWNNPTLLDFQRSCAGWFPQASVAINAGTPIPQKHRSSGKESRAITWPAAVLASRAWMQVRHNLTHGVANGWRSEHWSPPRDPNDPHATAVLLKQTHGWSLNLYGAINCARIYSLGAQSIADAVADSQSQVLDWTGLPKFG